MKQYNILITQGETCFVAKNIDLGVVSQGATTEEALFNIKEATELFLKDDDDTLTSSIVYHPAILTSISLSTK